VRRPAPGTAAGELETGALRLGLQPGFWAVALHIAAIEGARRFCANAVLVFWLACILTRPLGAGLGDPLPQVKTRGAVGLDPILASAMFVPVTGEPMAMSQREATQGFAPAPRWVPLHQHVIQLDPTRPHATRA
jgi:uncharacterized membrane-anchored protein